MPTLSIIISEVQSAVARLYKRQVQCLAEYCEGVLPPRISSYFNHCNHWQGNKHNASNTIAWKIKTVYPTVCRRKSKTFCDACRPRDVNDTRLRGALRHFLEGFVSGSAFGTFGILRGIAHLPLMLFLSKEPAFLSSASQPKVCESKFSIITHIMLQNYLVIIVGIVAIKII